MQEYRVRMLHIRSNIRSTHYTTAKNPTEAAQMAIDEMKHRYPLPSKAHPMKQRTHEVWDITTIGDAS